MQRWIEAIISRPVTVAMLTLAGIVFGVVGFGRLPLELLPDISYPSVTVQTELEDAAPEEVEQLVTWPVEQVVGVVNGLKRCSSVSRAGVSEVTLEFRWDTNMDVASLDVREKLDLVDLPDAALSPIVYRFDPSLDPIMRLSITGDLSVRDLRKLGEDVAKKQLEVVAGVAAVKVVGGADEEVVVELDEGRLNALGISIDEVARRINEENVNRSAGELRAADTAYLIRTISQYKSLAEIDQVILRESPDGAQVRLSDVGKTSLMQKDREIRSRVNGVAAVELHLYKEGDANAVRVSRGVRARIDELRKDNRFAGTELAILFDQARYIEDSVESVKGTALLGAALAALVLFLFLRDLRSTLLITISIPISVMVTFLLMHVSHITLNVMSMGGLALGVGMLVDNSVVVLEAVARRREGGAPLAQAVVAGTSEVVGGIASSTLTTICVFLPLVFVDGVAGQLFYDQAMTVTFALLASLFVSVTVIPTVLAASSAEWLTPLFRGVDTLLRPLTWPVQRGLDVLTRFYDRTLGSTLGTPWVFPLVAALLFVAIVPLGRDLGTELVPKLLQGEFYYDVELPEGTPLAVTDARVAELEQIVADLAAERPEIVNWHATVGGAPVLGDLRAGDRQDHIARVNVKLAEGVRRDVEEELAEALTIAFRQVPNCPVRLGRPSLFTFRDPIEVEVYAPQLDDLYAATAQVLARLEHVPGLIDVKSSVAERSPEVHVELDPTKLVRAGLSQGAVAETLAAKGLGEVRTQYAAAEKPIDIRVRMRGSRNTNIGDVAARSVKQEPGQTPVPLGALGELREGRGPVEIMHVGSDRAALVTARNDRRDLGSVSEAVEEQLALLQREAVLGPNATAKLSGQNEEMRESMQSLLLALTLAIFLVYLVLASTFESLRLPLVIILTVPLGLIGVVGSLWLLQMPIGVFAMIGVILLSGIVVNNGIIFVTRIQQHRSAGQSGIEATRVAGRERLRPILITSATTILGLLPLAVGLGAGAELRQPLAVTVIGGLVVATALTLQVVPAGYLLLAGRDRKGARDAEVAA